MRLVECAWLFDEAVEIGIARPKEASHNGQYVLILCGTARTHLILAKGGEQFQALTQCLVEAGLHMSGRFADLLRESKVFGSRQRKAADNRAITNQRFSDGQVFVELVAKQGRPADKRYDFTVHIPDHATGCRETIRMSEQELLSFGELFWNLGRAVYQPAFMASTDQWFIPPAFLQKRKDEHQVHAELFEQVAAHIRDKCPALADEWIEYLEQLRVPATEVTIFEPWLEVLPRTDEDNYELETGFLYTIGKDVAFDWMSEHPSATREELTEAVMKVPHDLPANLARQVVERIVDRVFQVMANR